MAPPSTTAPTTPRPNENTTTHEPEAEQHPPSPLRPTETTDGDPTTTNDNTTTSDAMMLQPKNTKAGRGTRELNPRQFDAAERREFDKADLKQLTTWKEKDAIEIIVESKVKSVPFDRILPGRARVVRTNKGQPGQELQARSRIVVPGHLDQDLGEFRSDAPTAPQMGLFMVLTMSATFRWKLSAFDVEAAFLNGVPLERTLYVRPPLDLHGQNPRELWRLKKAVFGLTEAPRAWWLRIRKDLLETGWYEVPFLTAVFLLYDGEKGLVGVLLLHVDDGLTGGEGPRYRKALDDLKARAPLGQWREGKFEFTGRTLEQCAVTFETTLHQDKYWETVPEQIVIDKARKKWWIRP